MNQSQILIAEMSDADGTKMCVKTRVEQDRRSTFSLVAIHTLAAAEAFVLAERSGIDSRKLLQALSGGPASSVMLQIRGKIMADHEYEEKIGGIRLFSGLLSKIAQKASEQGDFRLLNAPDDEYQEAAAGGYRDYDIAALVEHISDRVAREKKA